MAGYTKLFSEILDSSVWQEPAEIRLVWITMLAMADRTGKVMASVPGLANRAVVPLKAVETALETFLAPDRYSRTKDNEGRRIKEIDGGWQILNHSKYRAKLSQEERHAYKLEWQRKRRQEKREQSTSGGNGPEDTLKTKEDNEDTVQIADNREHKEMPCATGSTGTYARADEFAIPNFEEVTHFFHLSGCPCEWVARDWFDFMESTGWRIQGVPVANWKAAAMRKVRWWEADGRHLTQEDAANRGKPKGQNQGPGPGVRKAPPQVGI